MGSKWSEADDQCIRDNVGRLSYGQIAAKLNTGVSRNAVVGRASRLGLTNTAPKRDKGYPGTAWLRPKRKALARTSQDERTGGAGQYKEVVLTEPAVAPVEGLVCEPVSFADREPHQCNWPIDGDMFCGLRRLAPYADSRTGRRTVPAYCPAHHRQSVAPDKYRSGIWRGPT